MECPKCKQEYNELPRLPWPMSCVECGEPLNRGDRFRLIPIAVAAAGSLVALVLPHSPWRLLALALPELLVVLQLASGAIVRRAQVVGADEAAEQKALRRYTWSGVIVASVLAVASLLTFRFLWP